MSDALAIIILIVAIIALTAFSIFIRRLMRKGINKAFDAARNHRIDRQERNNPPTQQNLADRYRNQ